jgi:hypothetical protein
MITLIDADEQALRAVVIGGRVRLADPALSLIPAADAETVRVAAVDKYIDIRDAMQTLWWRACRSLPLSRA